MIAWSLAAISAAFGLIAAWTIAQLTDTVAASRARKKIGAHFLELRLFANQPRLLFRAQKALITAYARFFLVMLRPTAILAVPAAWLLMQLDCVYGIAPLAIGHAAIVTVQVNGPLRLEDVHSALAAPPEIAVETPPVRIPSEAQISWRIRPLRPVCGRLSFTIRGITYAKAICAGERRVFLLPRRMHSLWIFLLHPEESRLPSGDVEWLDVAYPTPDVNFAGVALPWLAWFVLISTITAFGFSRFMRAPL